MISLLVCLTSHTYKNYPMSKNKKILRLVQKEEVESPAFSVLVSLRYSQHEGCCWRGHHGLLCRNYLILPSYDLKDAVVLA